MQVQDRHEVTAVRLSPKCWHKLLVFSFDPWRLAQIRGDVRVLP